MKSSLIEFVLEDAPPLLNILLTLKHISTDFIGSLEDDLRRVDAEWEFEIIIKLDGCCGVEVGVDLGDAIAI